MAPATELLDELIEEIFFRIHPADAVTLARAALVCKRWCRLIADPGFLRRLAEFHHRVPPMLGFFCNIDDRDRSWYYSKPPGVARFLRTSSGLERVDIETSFVVDTRHGRVLVLTATGDWRDTTGYLWVWDPITKEKHTLPWLWMPQCPKTWNAAVLCTADDCDHLDCHGKPFAVVLVSACHIGITGVFSLVYSSEAPHRWSDKETHLVAQQQEDPLELEPSPSALVGNALYFVLQGKTKILKYSVGKREMHVINLPSSCASDRRILLMNTEDGRLGFATVRDDSKLCLWSRDGDSNRVVGWTQMRVIDLEALLPTRALDEPTDVVGFANGVGFFFIKTKYSGHFRIDITSSNRVKKIRPVWGGSTIFPYMSFHIPALGAVAASRGGGPSMGASST